MGEVREWVDRETYIKVLKKEKLALKDNIEKFKKQIV